MKIDILSVSHRERQNSAIKHQLIVQAKYNGKQKTLTTNEMGIALHMTEFLSEYLVQTKAFYSRDFRDVMLYNSINPAETYFKVESIGFRRKNPESEYEKFVYTGNSRIIIATPHSILSRDKKEYSPVALLEDFIHSCKDNFK